VSGGGVPIRGVLSRHGGNGAMNDHRIRKIDIADAILSQICNETAQSYFTP
jgi:hypothetical protein